jgi:uncharacterized protein (TIGR02453 family)
MLEYAFFILYPLGGDAMPTALHQTLSFLEDLRFNNNRAWFEANRKRYEAARAAAEALVTDILAQFAPVEAVGSTAAKDCFFRLNRDVRFSKDKSPYKTNFGIVLGAGGRKTTGRSYYLNLEPGDVFIATGVYDPTPEQLKHIRAAIAEDPAKLRRIITAKAFQDYFGGLSGDALKTAPKGYGADHPALDLLRFKQFLAVHQVTDEQALAEDFAAQVVQVCKALKPFATYLEGLRLAP